MGWAISDTRFIGVITQIGSVKPFNQPKKPLFLMLWYQMRALVIRAQVSVVLRSAVVDRRKPVMPMREPHREERNRVPM